MNRSQVRIALCCGDVAVPHHSLWTKGDGAMLTLAAQDTHDCTQIDPQSLESRALHSGREWF